MLERCPICQSMPHIMETSVEPIQCKYFCSRNSHHMDIGNWFYSQEQAAFDWNRRVESVRRMSEKAAKSNPTREELEEIIKDDKLSEQFAKNVYKTCVAGNFSQKGKAIAQAILDENVHGFLVALCGQNVNALLHKDR